MSYDEECVERLLARTVKVRIVVMSYSTYGLLAPDMPNLVAQAHPASGADAGPLDVIGQYEEAS